MGNKQSIFYSKQSDRPGNLSSACAVSILTVWLACSQSRQHAKAQILGHCDPCGLEQMMKFMSPYDPLRLVDRERMTWPLYLVGGGCWSPVQPEETSHTA